METEKIKDIIENFRNKPNKDLVMVMDFLMDDFDKTKELIMKLTLHLDNTEKEYNKIYKEYKKRDEFYQNKSQEIINRFDDIVNLIKEVQNGKYIDSHCWQFTSQSFENIINILYTKNYIRLKVHRIYHTLNNSCEFYAILKNSL